MNCDLLNIKHCVVLVQSLNVTQILLSAEYLHRFFIHLFWEGGGPRRLMSYFLSKNSWTFIHVHRLKSSFYLKVP